jgi:glycosyltransferase involved in cell wall biosynthesis
MPVFNGERFLPEVLDSLLGQTYGDYELVICDNASTDGTWEICTNYAKQDTRIRLLRNSRNIGAAGNYNRVVHEARGQFFKWAAADDLIAPEFLDHCINALDADPEAVLAYPRTKIIDEKGHEVADYEDLIDVTATDPVQRFDNFIRLVGECNAVFGVIRMASLRQTPMIGAYISSDKHLLAELALHGRFIQIPDRMFFRRDHAAASSADKSLRAQMAFYQPAWVDRIVFPAWSAQRADFGAMRRAPLSMTERLRLFALLLRRMIRTRKRLVHDLTRAVAMVRHGALRRSASAAPRAAD